MWLVIGLVFGVAIMMLVWWLRNRNISFTWYEWLIGAAGLVMLFFAIQNYFGSLDELEPTAATSFLLIVGLPGLVLLAIVGLLTYRRIRTG